MGLKGIDQLKVGTTLPNQYFPDVEYPTNIMEASKPFFYKTCECNAMLGPFPDDVKSSFQTLIDNNKETLEELKTMYFNARNCLQENTGPSQPEEETIEEAVTVLEEIDVTRSTLKKKTVKEAEVMLEKGDDDEIADERDKVVIVSVSENTVGSTLEDTDIEENQFSETTSQLKEVITSEIVEFPKSDFFVEDDFRSWESEQFFSAEIITQTT